MPTKSKPQSAEADLAFLRSIVEGGGRPPLTLAVCYLAGGLLYGAQCLFHIAQAWGLIAWPGLVNLGFILAINLTMLGFIVWAVQSDKRTGSGLHGPASSRAMSAGLSAAGLANVAMVIIFGVGSARDQDFAIWLFYPAVVFGLQAAAWFMAWTLRKQAWMLATALGGWAATIALGLLVREPLIYLYVCTASLFLLFALPGWHMYRQIARVSEA